MKQRISNLVVTLAVFSTAPVQALPKWYCTILCTTTYYEDNSRYGTISEYRRGDKSSFEMVGGGGKSTEEGAFAEAERTCKGFDNGFWGRGVATKLKCESFDIEKLEAAVTKSAGEVVDTLVSSYLKGLEAEAELIGVREDLIAKTPARPDGSYVPRNIPISEGLLKKLYGDERPPVCAQWVDKVSVNGGHQGKSRNDEKIEWLIQVSLVHCPPESKSIFVDPMTSTRTGFDNPPVPQTVLLRKPNITATVGPATGITFVEADTISEISQHRATLTNLSGEKVKTFLIRRLDQNVKTRKTNEMSLLTSDELGPGTLPSWAQPNKREGLQIEAFHPIPDFPGNVVISDVFSRDTSKLKLGDAWRDPRGRIWGEMVQNDDGSSRFMNHYDATEYCKSIGAELPSRDDFLRLREYLGAKPGIFGYEGYEPGLPNLIYMEGGKSQSRYYWSSDIVGSYTKNAYAFYGINGELKPRYRSLVDYSSVRCVSSRH